MADPSELQRRYYASTSRSYDELHVAKGDEHFTALRYIAGLLPTLQCSSLLDVGTGTGRALTFLREHSPDLEMAGVEPVQELIEEAVTRHGVPRGLLHRAAGEELPFGDASFDAVCALGVMHHARDVPSITREMTRVARRAVFISDVNRFGRGGPAARWSKLVLYRLGLWKYADLVKTRGRGYRLSDGDGISYSYSIYDSYRELSSWAHRVFMIPTVPPVGRSWAHPLLTADHVLLCAVRDG